MIDINNNRLIIKPNNGFITSKELKEKIKGLNLLGFLDISIFINFNLLDIEEIKEGSKNDVLALEIYKKSKYQDLKINSIKNKKIEFENSLCLTLENQDINYIQINFK